MASQKNLGVTFPGFLQKLHSLVTHISQELFVLEISLCLFHSFFSKASSAVVKLESRAVPGDVTRKVAQQEPYSSLGFIPDSLQLWNYKLNIFEYLSETSCHKYTQF